MTGRFVQGGPRVTAARRISRTIRVTTSRIKIMPTCQAPVLLQIKVAWKPGTADGCQDACHTRFITSRRKALCMHACQRNPSFALLNSPGAGRP